MTLATVIGIAPTVKSDGSVVLQTRDTNGPEAAN
jgi:hypothetical protein